MILQRASTLRGELKYVIEPEGEVTSGFLSRVKFMDGVTWAAKVSDEQFAQRRSELSRQSKQFSAIVGIFQ